MDREEEEAKLNPDDLDKEQIEEMSEEEVLVWYAKFAYESEIREKRKELLKFVEVRDMTHGSRIHVDSTVIQ